MVKRLDGPSVEKFWNLLCWVKCVICGYEFVREDGWVYLSTRYHYTGRHACGSCCTNEKEALDKLASYCPCGSCPQDGQNPWGSV